MKNVIIIAGPTAVGKTELALELSLQHNGEVISADSMQIYKYMDIGSAKPSPEELGKVPHHLIDILKPSDPFTVSDYQNAATIAIEAILSKGKLPVVSGGTGLYINSLLYKMAFSSQAPNKDFRDEMERLAATKGCIYLYNLLQAKSPQVAETIHPNNIKRVIRALEIAEFSSSEKGDFSKDLKQNDDFSFKLLCLTRPRDELYDRINRRVDLMMSYGLLEEVKKLKTMGYNSSMQAMQGIGYKELLNCLSGHYTLEEAVRIIKKNSRHYAKRQLTWFKRYPEAQWIDLSQYQDTASALREINNLIF